MTAQGTNQNVPLQFAIIIINENNSLEHHLPIRVLIFPMFLHGCICCWVYLTYFVGIACIADKLRLVLTLYSKLEPGPYRANHTQCPVPYLITFCSTVPLCHSSSSKKQISERGKMAAWATHLSQISCGHFFPLVLFRCSLDRLRERWTACSLLTQQDLKVTGFQCWFLSSLQVSQLVMSTISWRMCFQSSKVDLGYSRHLEFCKDKT